MSETAARKGLSLTLMERLIDEYKEDAPVRMLCVQYRMHETIMSWASNALYDGRLTAHESVQGHLLKDLPGIQQNENTGIKRSPVNWIGVYVVSFNTHMVSSV